MDVDNIKTFLIGIRHFSVFLIVLFLAKILVEILKLKLIAAFAAVFELEYYFISLVHYLVHVYS